MIQKKKKDYIFNFNVQLLFLLIFFSNSKYALLLNGITRMALLVLVGLVFFISNRTYTKQISIKPLILFMILLISSLIIMLFYSDSSKWYVIAWGNLIVAYLVFISMSYIDFIVYFTKIMKLLAIFSLVVYVIYTLNIWDFSIFPTFEGHRNIFFSTIYLDKNHMNAFRNYGIFWEPGAYQTFLNLALVFEIFIKEKKSLNTGIIYIIAIITTLSVTAYIATILIVFTYIISGEKLECSKIMKNDKFKLIVIFTVILIISFFIMPDNYKNQLVRKFAIFTNINDATNISGFVRVNSLITPLSYYSDSFLLGIGLNNFIEMTNDTMMGMATFTPINWFAAFGFIWGFVCNFFFVAHVKLMNGNFVSKSLIIIAMFITISSENYFINASILLIVFYGMNVIFSKRRLANENSLC